MRRVRICVNDMRSSNHIGGYFTCHQCHQCHQNNQFYQCHHILVTGDAEEHCPKSLKDSASPLHQRYFSNNLIRFDMAEIHRKVLKIIFRNPSVPLGLLTPAPHNLAQKKPDKRNCVVCCQPQFNRATPNAYSCSGLMSEFCHSVNIQTV